MTQQNRLTLAGALRRVLDEGPYSRAEWAEMLDVSTAALSQWVNGRQLPTQQNLQSLYDAAMETEGVSEDVQSQLKEVFRRPLHEVLATVKPNMGRTLADYVQRAATEEAMKLLMALPADDQRRIVAQVGVACRAALAGPRTTGRPRFERARRLLDDEPAQTWAWNKSVAA